MSVAVRFSVKELKEYEPGKSVKGAVKLSSNENPLGPSPKALRAVLESVSGEEGELNLSVYPAERDEDELRDEISKYLSGSVRKENVVLGAGVDGVLETLAKIFIEPGDEAVIPVPTFSLYESVVKIAGGVPRFVERERERERGSDFSVPVEDLISACSEKTRLIFLASPNNPTGNCTPEQEVREILDAVPPTAVVVLDEAYAEFAGEEAGAAAGVEAGSSLLGLVKEHENAVVLRTFSKAFGLAGLRVGYGVVPEWLASHYKKVAMPFSVNCLALKAAVAALHDTEHLRKTVALVREERAFLTENLQRLEGFRVFPSQANFVLLDVSPRKSAEVCELLLKNGVVVRDCSSFRAAGDSLVRISVGTREQNEKVVEVLREERKNES